MAYNRPILSTQNNRSKGNIGEDIACKFLLNKGFIVVERNFLRKWGELDIIAKAIDQKDNAIHFFEVKSVLVESFVSSGPAHDDRHRPEENVHAFKVRQIRRMIDTYLAYSGRGSEAEFFFHVLCVFMDMQARRSRVKWIQNVIL